MDNTAMVQMIAQLKLQLGAEKVSQMIDDAFWLDKERQQIEEAFNDGFYGVSNTGSTYYENKYTEK